MKKRIAYLLLSALCLLLFSCGTTPSMTELLSYQKSGAVFEAKIYDGDEFTAKITLGDPNTVELLGDDGTSGIRFVLSGEQTLLEYNGASMRLPSPEKLRPAKWVSLLTLSGSSLWSIKSETLSGIAVYICTCDTITLYIDAATKTPLKITDGDIVIDILSCQ